MRNHLEILRRVLTVAHRRKLIGAVPILELRLGSGSRAPNHGNLTASFGEEIENGPGG